MRKILFLFAIIATVVFTSCTKEGKAGKDGNANVISSNTVTINNWTKVLDDGINYDYTANISFASITDEVKNKGLVLIYCQQGSDWYALPYTDAGTDATTGLKYSNSFNYSINTGSTKIECNGFDDSGTASGVTENIVVRIVVIPASITSKYPNTNWKDYKEVDRLVNTYRTE